MAKEWTKDDGAALDGRIQTLWVAVTKSRHPYGAYAWFARLVDVRPRTVRRWVRAVHDPRVSDVGREAMSTLDSMEKIHADSLPAARAVLTAYAEGGSERLAKGE